MGAATALIVLTLGMGREPAAQQSATLATHAVGTGFNAMGMGIGAVVCCRIESDLMQSARFQGELRVPGPGGKRE